MLPAEMAPQAISPRTEDTRRAAGNVHPSHPLRQAGWRVSPRAIDWFRPVAGVHAAAGDDRRHQTPASWWKGFVMYLHRPQTSWPEQIIASARTLAAVFVVALLASALTVRWSNALATGNTRAELPAAAIPVTVEGALVAAGDGMVALVEHGSESPVAFSLSTDTQLVRQGQPVAVDALRSGDTVRMTIDGRSGTVLRLHADPVAGPAFHVSGDAALLAALGLIAGATALAIRNLERLPTLPTRVVVTRLLPAGAAR